MILGKYHQGIVPGLLESPHSLGTHTLSLFGAFSRDLMYL